MLFSYVIKYKIIKNKNINNKQIEDISRLKDSFWKYGLKSQKKIIVYNIPNHTAVDFISGNKHHFIADHKLLKNKEKIQYLELLYQNLIIAF